MFPDVKLATRTVPPDTFVNTAFPVDNDVAESTVVLTLVANMFGTVTDKAFPPDTVNEVNTDDPNVPFDATSDAVETLVPETTEPALTPLTCNVAEDTTLLNTFPNVTDCPESTPVVTFVTFSVPVVIDTAFTPAAVSPVTTTLGNVELVAITLPVDTVEPTTESTVALDTFIDAPVTILDTKFVAVSFVVITFAVVTVDVTILLVTMPVPSTALLPVTAVAARLVTFNKPVLTFVAPCKFINTLPTVTPIASTTDPTVAFVAKTVPDVTLVATPALAFKLVAFTLGDPRVLTLRIGEVMSPKMALDTVTFVACTEAVDIPPAANVPVVTLVEITLLDVPVPVTTFNDPIEPVFKNVLTINDDTVGNVVKLSCVIVDPTVVISTLPTVDKFANSELVVMAFAVTVPVVTPTEILAVSGVSNVYPGLVVLIPTFPPVVMMFPTVFVKSVEANSVRTYTVPAVMFVFKTLFAVIVVTVSPPAILTLPDTLNVPPVIVVADTTVAPSVLKLPVVANTVPAVTLPAKVLEATVVNKAPAAVADTA